jgi:hypothetical protein
VEYGVWWGGVGWDGSTKAPRIEKPGHAEQGYVVERHDRQARQIEAWTVPAIEKSEILAVVGSGSCFSTQGTNHSISPDTPHHLASGQVWERNHISSSRFLIGKYAQLYIVKFVYMRVVSCRIRKGGFAASIPFILTGSSMVFPRSRLNCDVWESRNQYIPDTVLPILPASWPPWAHYCLSHIFTTAHVNTPR